MSISNWTEISKDWQKEEGGEQWTRKFSDTAWLSYLYRMTGFGFMEHETALCEILPVQEGQKRTWKDRRCDIVIGDRREEFNDMTLEQVREWYKANKEGNLNSMESLLGALKDAATSEKAETEVAQ